MNKMVLFAFVAALLAIQACSKKSHKETSEFVEEGAFSNDPGTKVISKDEKFLCDFQWTDGYSNWDYDSDGDKPIGKLGSAKESWCLIPYGEPAEYEVAIQDTVEGGGKARHYFCRSANSIYTIANESEVTIANDAYYKEMKCAELNSDSTITIMAGTSSTPYKDERLYHVISQADNEDYSIMGHLDLLLVKPVHLSVLWESIWNIGIVNGMKAANLDIQKIKEDWKKYMLKIGYYIDIETVPIVFPNIMERVSGVDDGALTLPSEKDILELPDNFDRWYNGAMSVFEFISGLFGQHPDLSRVKRVNYVIATTPGYNVRYDVQKLTFSETRKDTVKNITGTIIVSKGTCSIFAKDLDYLKNIKDMPNAPLVDYYSKTNVKLGTSVSGVAIFETSQQDCDNASYASGANYGSKAQAFSINKGYVLSDKNFFNSKNTGRLLAALLYSKIQGVKYPINEDNGRWLSSYTDDGYVEQPKRYWEIREKGSNGEQQMLLEFASVMLYLKGE